ncbi:MAG: transcriptional coactivator p15/PC4 family protein [Bacteroidetes bacterium]|nr:transcriptional coactivator p15/PC4 family protein [Bacteroidota bacterium]
MESDIHYDKLIDENLDKFYQVRLTVSEFKEKYYLNIRKYFLSYDGEYIPSKDGISMEATLDNTSRLVEGLLEILSNEEGQLIIRKLYDRYCR